nr:bifunctional diaminohydroxyphosphoribosylaminopyrimidine deaminase/5-amino-6-(5-phosphoribosylamino)uracil reductase RibD [Candidatus Acidoferrales bacterium]
MRSSTNTKQAADDAKWMDRALELARRGVALAGPNPMVGAVLVKNGRVVGEGFHTYQKIKHAEIIALESAGNKSRGATLYINLEPCSHHGRTPPCVKSLINAGVRRVIAAMRDPNPKVAGRGFKQLCAAGIKVEIGLRQREAQELNEGFARWITARLPLVTLKSAITLDGAIAWPKRTQTKSPRWITSAESRSEVQKMRHASDAILTGIGTVLADDPLLTDRTKLPRRHPLLRVILDTRLRLPLRSKLVRSAKNDVFVFTAANLNTAKAIALHKAGVELFKVKRSSGGLDIRAILRELGRREIQNVMIEAGTKVNSAALLARVVDKLVIFGTDKIAGPGGKPWAEKRVADKVKKLSALRIQHIGPDYCYAGYLRDVYGNH